MQDYPHRYLVTATASTEGDVDLRADSLTPLRSAAPAEFGGPGDRWSPETLLVGAVGDCFVLTFRAVARSAKLAWHLLECDVRGTLDRVDGVPQFTRFEIHARLLAPAETDPDRARRALDRAERGCLIANSLKAHVQMSVDINVAANPAGALTEA
jgi:organic hydroperoxide reductase OsmC/OhrA